MSEVQIASVTPAPLTQWQRIFNIFIAPSKTFEDIRRGNRNWWLPLILLTLAAYVLFAAIYTRIGMSQVVENQIRMSPKAEERMANLTPEQAARGEKISVAVTEGAFLAAPLITLASAAILAFGLLGTINFGFGGRASYGEIFALFLYAWLPGIVKTLMGIAVIYAGMAPEAFNVKNFAPTNLGAFLDPVDTNRALYTLASSLDIVTIWMLILLGMGTAIVSGVKRSASYTVVFAWWAVFVLVGAAWAAAFS